MRQPVLTCVTYADRNHVRFRSTVPVKVSTKSDTGCRHRLLSLSLHSFNRGVPRERYIISGTRKFAKQELPPDQYVAQLIKSETR